MRPPTGSTPWVSTFAGLVVLDAAQTPKPVAANIKPATRTNELTLRIRTTFSPRLRLARVSGSRCEGPHTGCGFFCVEHAQDGHRFCPSDRLSLDGFGAEDTNR